MTKDILDDLFIDDSKYIVMHISEMKKLIALIQNHTDAIKGLQARMDFAEEALKRTERM